MAGRLDGKVAVITGSTSGIGRASAVLFAKEGAKVVVNGRRKDLGDEVVAEIHQSGGTATFFHADVAVEGKVEALVQHAADTYGRLDIMMNNANASDGSYKGHRRGGGVAELEEGAWDAYASTPLKTIFLGCKYAIPEMIKVGGGSIINMSSVHGLLVNTGSPTYETAKAGMIHLTRQVATDYGRQGIRANAICPGLIVIEKFKERFGDEQNMRREELLYPVGRPGYPIDVAYAALYLASDESTFVTGLCLVVDGGLTIQLQETVLYTVEEALRKGGGDY